MKINVEIRVINEVRKGVSASTGREWSSQDVVVAWPEKLADGRDIEHVQLLTLHGEQVERFAALKPVVGMHLVADISFGTRSFNNRVYNENRLYV